ncbi:hypothetical protein [Erythrobacter fulvus]|uniref:hypothetical protein n=1 Tax=Erythrobacter fulvus TaxID=2987523 RepID=UPI0035AC1BEB
MIGDNRLPAFVHVNVLHSLLARLVQLAQRLQCRSAIGLSLERQPHIAFAGIEILAHIYGGSARQFCEHRIERHCLRGQNVARKGLVALSRLFHGIADNAGAGGNVHRVIVAEQAGSIAVADCCVPWPRPQRQPR